MKGNVMVGGGVVSFSFIILNYWFWNWRKEKERDARLGWRDIKQATHPNPRAK